ncbi:MAG: hypothetical protein AAFR58_02835 [Cyanobacteria bacterium J06627_28]
MISVPITLEQLIQAVKKLQPEEREQVARALVQSELTSDLADLLQSLYSQSPADDISDADIMTEVRAVRQLPR